jgi:SAM-dependent methyltransferase
MRPEPTLERARPPVADPRREQAIADLGRELRVRGYRFVAPTPETHRRVIARRAQARDLRDIFGWSLPFAEAALPARLLGLLERAGALTHSPEGCRSALRFSTLTASGADLLLAHSAYPTVDADAVFLGPDTYRFAAMIERAAPGHFHRAVDVGCGGGAGGMSIAARCEQVVLADINPAALALSRANLALNGVRNARTAVSDVLDGVDGGIDLVIANPPYLADDRGRLYRDGGGQLGTGLALRIVDQALQRLAPGGTLALYTGTPVVGGVDLFLRAVRERLAAVAVDVEYRELDPDVFGDELDRPAYADCERIAVVGLTIRLAVQS